MKTALLDVNVLIALAWPNHQHHREAREWFNSPERGEWSSCPITQNGFLRISSNPKIIESAVSVLDAFDFLNMLIEHPDHCFWPDSLDFSRIDPRPAALLQGYRQITDAYLVGLAAENNGVLATLDKRILSAVRGSVYEAHVITLWD